MAVMFALAQSLMKYRGGWDAVKLKGKGVKVRCKVSVWRSARPEPSSPSYLKLMAVRAGCQPKTCLVRFCGEASVDRLTTYVLSTPQHNIPVQ